MYAIRSYYGKSLLSGLLASLLAPSLLLGAAQAADAKNVIFFLGDGMGPTSVTAARLYKVGEAGSLTMETLPYSARIKTFSNDAQTTDSAPSMSAYMTGVKMNNEVISMSTETQAVAPDKDVNGNKTVNNCASDNGTPATTLVITSYSIHYTKLYELSPSVGRSRVVRAAA